MASKSVRNELVVGENRGHSCPSLGYEASWTSSPLLRSGRSKEEDSEEDLKWAAIERLPTMDRIRKGLLKVVLDNGEVVHCLVDAAHLRLQDKKHLLDTVLKFVDDDNEKFLRKLRDRINRVGIRIPKIEIRYENLSVEGNVHVGNRSLPTLLNVTLNTFETILGLVGLASSKKRKLRILKDVSGIVKPSR
ncbi:hypothetical protein DEO72_LG6g2752 [Vigna unguiculata]|uniref:Pleiotropic ABC efflux transporter N-terminal domain-containing protein n=1 Tax=Vigna unguiculata TaxID=3917 RepID=A0A4D6MAN3_VIGUN|nr:hypothetical protein DEO72_LG6g2752 [Vigna unguiculata]